MRMSSIQFYRHFAGEPHFNMAFDEWMLERAGELPETVLLRLYTWRVPTITFGYNQRQQSAFDQSRVGETPVIRRITGGRALLHDRSEVTYAIAANFEGVLKDRLGASLALSSATIAEALRGFLERAGYRADYVRQSSAHNSRPEFFHKAPCFASVARFELTDGERKIIASAQRREGGLLLQHGSIKWRGVAAHPALPLAPGTTTDSLEPLDEASFAMIAGLFVEAFGERLGLPHRTEEVGSEQLVRICARSELVEKKACDRREISKQNPQPNSL